MAVIGAFGNIPFVVSAEILRTFEDFERKIEARWATHNLLNSKPKPEFVGPDLDTITFKMRFDVRYGINPRNEMDKLVNITNQGKALPLIIGGKSIGNYRWTIIKLGQFWKEIDNRGNLLIGTIDIELQEYPYFASKIPIAVKKATDVPCSIKVNGKTLTEKGFVRNGQGFVPVRIVLRELGKENTLVWSREYTTIKGVILSTFINRDGTGFAWSREIGEILNVKVTWQQGIIEFNS